MTLLLLIRHGMNEMVGQKRLAGRMPEVHLNDVGRTQADDLAERLRTVPIHAIYCSPLERTQETAAPLGRIHNLPVQVRPGLIEVEYGDWTGKPLEELYKHELWRVVQTYPSGMRFPGGEGMRDMQMRMVAELEAIAADHPRQIVAIVGHADLIKAAVAHYLGVHLDLFQRISIEPVSVSVVQLTRWGPRILRLNDDGPLKLEPEKEEPPAATDTPTEQAASTADAPADAAR